MVYSKKALDSNPNAFKSKTNINSIEVATWVASDVYILIMAEATFSGGRAWGLVRSPSAQR